ncbi:SDR family oxidoreductase [Achromobacter xylosoxidans]|uniref:SDR family oxidoreductase n=1 Tax=Alcaligenes xylosoxydans xylosoxydans TaxID=85698 RepID=A0A424WBV5_ALCXX|nr:SDR family oxidoreductase [Achromobacter xylosoxidans]MBC9906593.1 SDR family oxidoreductase [Achromobacter xylosoxidans]MBD0870206.1 SDR family oxidoreductase [Achromobacter xylosoxidans]QNP87036.1 SDR family oxidoreductase [Achromobacter xylosoxidans]RPJ90833.1 SDR family oxidoreductase [Achromobacter xylosoxidans]
MSKIMLVTGGGRGIGAAVAKLAARRGYAVGVNYHANADTAHAVVAEIVQGGGRAVALQADVSQEDQVLRMYGELDRQLGRIDALVNNAGILEQQMRVDQMSAERLLRVLSTNVIGAFLCAREAVRRMSTRHGGQGGAIVNVSSAAARLGSPNEYVDYAASKGAMDTMTIGLSKEVAPEGIRVNGVRPGTIYTDMHASGGEPGRVDRLKGVIPLRRGGTVEEVAGAVMWLLSDEAGYTSGSFIDVSGGN